MSPVLHCGKLYHLPPDVFQTKSVLRKKRYYRTAQTMGFNLKGVCLTLVLVCWPIGVSAALMAGGLTAVTVKPIPLLRGLLTLLDQWRLASRWTNRR